MRIPQLVLAVAGTLMCTGCSELISLHPFVSDKEAVQDARLLGVWVDEDDTYQVRQDGNGYLINYTEKKATNVYKLKAKMLKVGDARILDLTPVEEDPFRLAVHTPVRVWFEGATLKIAFLHSQWMKDHAAAELAVQDAGDRMLITSPDEAVTHFLMTYGGDDRAYKDTGVLTRQP